MILRRGVAVDDHELVSAKEARETGRGVNHERSAADDEHVRMGNGIHRTVDHVVVERFLVKNDIGLNLAAAQGTYGHALRVLVLTRHDPLGIVGLAAALANVTMHRAVQLKDVLRARYLVKTVDILSYYCDLLAVLFQLGKFFVRGVQRFYQFEVKKSPVAFLSTG